MAEFRGVSQVILRTLYHSFIAARIPIPASLFRAYESVRASWEGGEEPGGLPPPKLRMRVAGSADAGVFEHGGVLAYQAITSALRSAGRRLDEFPSILDFGCGCGRVLRLLRKLKGARLIGADVDCECIEWCRSNYPDAEFLTVVAGSPLELETGSVHFAYAFSVLTHLDRESQDFWLGELQRVLAPGGVLLCSTHGEVCLDRLSQPEARRFCNGEMVVHFPNANTSNLCNSFHPPDLFRSQVSPWFDVLNHVPQGALGNAPQDLWILENILKRASGAGLQAGF